MPRRDVLMMLGIAVLYWLGARLGLYFADIGPISLIWPPTGMALVSLIVFGTRLWPGVLLGALLAEFGANVPHSTAVAWP